MSALIILRFVQNSSTTVPSCSIAFLREGGTVCGVDDHLRPMSSEEEEAGGGGIPDGSAKTWMSLSTAEAIRSPPPLPLVVFVFMKIGRCVSAGGAVGV